MCKLPHLTCKRDHIKMRDDMDRRVTPPKQVTSPTRSPPPPCKQAIKGRDDTVPRKLRDGEAICFSHSHQPRDFRRNFKRNGHQKLSMLMPLVVPLEF